MPAFVTTRVSEVESSVALSFVLLSEQAYPDPGKLIESASELGLSLTYESSGENSMVFAVASGGQLLLGLMPAPHPDAHQMPTGPLSPDANVVAQHVGHYIITGFGLPGSELDIELTMCKLTAAVIVASPAVAAMLGPGLMFYRADVFAGMVATSAAEGQVPSAITVDITAERESETRMSFLTHGLHKYGREEFYLTAPIEGTGAISYLMMMVNWMITDRDKVLPTGDTVGRTADEKILIQRVPSPIPDKPNVIRLDMDADASPPPKKKGLFRRG